MQGAHKTKARLITYEMEFHVNHLYDSYSDIEAFLWSTSYLNDLLHKTYLLRASDSNYTRRSLRELKKTCLFKLYSSQTHFEGASIDNEILINPKIIIGL